MGAVPATAESRFNQTIDFYTRVDFPAQVRSLAERPLIVLLTLQPTGATVLETKVGVTFADVRKPTHIEIVAAAPSFTEHTQSWRRVITVYSQTDSQPAVFLLKAGAAVGPQLIRLDFYHQGRLVGSGEFATEVTPNITSATPERKAQSTNLQLVGSGEFATEVTPNITSATPERKAQSTNLQLEELLAKPPASADLELGIVFNRQTNELHFTLHSEIAELGYQRRFMGTTPLNQNPRQLMDSTFARLNQYARHIASTPGPSRHLRPSSDEQASNMVSSFNFPTEIADEIEIIGQDLFQKVFPPALQQEYWQLKTLREQGKIRSLLLFSDELWIPWELVKPYTFDNKTNQELTDDYLCVAFQFVRWLAEHVPLQHIEVRKARMIITEGNPPATERVKNFFTALEKQGLVVGVPLLTRAEVLKTFKEGDLDLLHIEAHGYPKNPDESSITLQDSERLRPSDFAGARSVGFRRKRPIVFFNSGHTSQVEFSLTSLGGWTERMVGDLGVSIYVCALWEINSEVAADFAVEFYKNLIAGQRLGEAFHATRLMIRMRYPNTFDWLGYTVYGDANCRLIWEFTTSEFKIRLIDNNFASVFLLIEGSNIIGQNPDSNLVLYEPPVSSKHAEVICSNNQCRIIDLNSESGTFVNGENLKPNISRLLLPNDVIRIGHYILIFQQSSKSKGFAGDIFARLSNSAQNALQWAEGLREAIGAEALEPFHLLAGLMNNKSSSAYRVLTIFDKAETVIKQLESLFSVPKSNHLVFAQVNSASPDLMSTYPLSQKVQDILADAAELADSTNSPTIRMRYILSSLLIIAKNDVGQWIAELLQVDYSTLLISTVSKLGDAPDIERIQQASIRNRISSIAYELKLRTVPELVPIYGEFSVEIELLPLADGNSGLDVIEVPARETELNLLLKAPAGFEVLKTNALTLVLEAATSDSSALLLTPQRGRFQLMVMRPTTSADIVVEILTNTGLRFKRKVTVQVQELRTETEPELHLPVRTPRPIPHPDTIVQIQKEWNQEQSAFHLHYTLVNNLIGEAHAITFQSKQLVADWIEQTHNLLGAILAGGNGAATEDRIIRLVAFGQYLMSQLGLESSSQLWQLVTNSRKRNVLFLVAGDAWVPWALLHNGRTFLGEQVTIGCWPLELEQICPAEFPVGKVHIAYYESVEDPARWSSLLQPLNAPEAELLPGGTLDSIEMINELRGLHLLRSGQLPGTSSINLPVLRQTPSSEMAAVTQLVSNEIKANSNDSLELNQVQLTLRRNRPLVSIGYLARGETDLAELPSHWATPLITAGSSAIVGSLWAVDQTVDALFVRSFYDMIWMGYALGEAFAVARQRVCTLTGKRVDGLAYLLFGDPMARPYLPVRSEGYAVIEFVGNELEDPVHPNEKLRFRLSLRRKPPVWHNERVVEISEELTFSQLQVRVITDGLIVVPASPIPMQKIDDDYWGWMSLTIPDDFSEESSLVQLYFMDGKRLIHSTTIALTVETRGMAVG